jgi:hypothetical protein
LLDRAGNSKDLAEIRQHARLAFVALMERQQSSVLNGDGSVIRQQLEIANALQIRVAAI